MTSIRLPLLKIQDLCKAFEIRRGLFGRNRQLVHALKRVSFEVFKGETVGLIGSSGSGKSTIGRILTGLEQADSGSIEFQGINLFALGNEERLEYRKHIQIVPQDTLFSLNPRRRVGSQTSIPCWI
jgi:oligopeptide transport system ATP-binding protein